MFRDGPDAQSLEEALRRTDPALTTTLGGKLPLDVEPEELQGQNPLEGPSSWLELMRLRRREVWALHRAMRTRKQSDVRPLR